MGVILPLNPEGRAVRRSFTRLSKGLCRQRGAQRGAPRNSIVVVGRRRNNIKAAQVPSRPNQSDINKLRYSLFNSLSFLRTFCHIQLTSIFIPPHKVEKSPALGKSSTCPAAAGRPYLPTMSADPAFPEQPNYGVIVTGRLSRTCILTLRLIFA